jgi:hypothetical protein
MKQESPKDSAVAKRRKNQDSKALKTKTSKVVTKNSLILLQESRTLEARLTLILISRIKKVRILLLILLFSLEKIKRKILRKFLTPENGRTFE